MDHGGGTFDILVAFACSILRGALRMTKQRRRKRVSLPSDICLARSATAKPPSSSVSRRPAFAKQRRFARRIVLGLMMRHAIACGRKRRRCELSCRGASRNDFKFSMTTSSSQFSGTILLRGKTTWPRKSSLRTVPGSRSRSGVPSAPLRNVDRQHVILPEDRRCGRITVYTGIESAGVENDATKTDCRGRELRLTRPDNPSMCSKRRESRRCPPRIAVLSPLARRDFALLDEPAARSPGQLCSGLLRNDL